VKYVKEKTIKEIVLNTDDFSSVRGKKQLEILETIKENNNKIAYDKLSEKIKNISKNINQFEERNLITINETKESDACFKSKALQFGEEITLSLEQEKAVAVISKDILESHFNTYLLHGVTGSGKTEVYIELIKVALKNNKTAMLIVPEISLTPQLLDRFKLRLGDNIAVLHSGLSQGKRSLFWAGLVSGKCPFIIGARSGVFAPIENIGVIIVDEEHDASFKQSDSFRYNARDVAIMRAKLSSCPIVLGSATPSLETYYNVILKKYRKLSLKNRFARHQNLNFEIINLNKIKRADMISSNITSELYEAIKETLQRSEQIFILYNKRGFASFLQCENCGEAIKCPNCSITLTYHQKENVLKCHQCDYKTQVFYDCLECKKNKEEGKLVLKGAGTEKIYDELKLLFPDASIARLDRDEAATLAKYEKILKDVRENKVDILVGTQMIAKGHDIPNVSLVVVVYCDISLFFPDFRATEKTFQLLTQVAGRAGRGDVAGKVILQTRNPDNIAIEQTVKSDYQGFASKELSLRKEMNYPPFSFLARLIVSHSVKEIAYNDIVLVRKLLEKVISKQGLKIQILGPAPAYIEKIRNLYRWNIILKSDNRKELNISLSFLNKHIKLRSKTKLVVDIDPQDMF
ncbi:MAG: replication restart helicase PriA, partial [Bdellovibrionota bacterium]